MCGFSLKAVFSILQDSINTDHHWHSNNKCGSIIDFQLETYGR